MKILLICHRVPYPPADGGTIAMLNMATSLEEAGHDVHLFCLNTNKHFVKEEDIPTDIRQRFHIKNSFINTSITLSGALKNLFTYKSYNVERFISSSVADDLVKLLSSQHFDIIQMETLFSSGYMDILRKYSNAKIILRAHNVEHIIWERLSYKERNPFKKSYLRFLSKRLKKYEVKTMNEVDGLVSITDVDATLYKKLGFTGPIISIPVGLNLKEYPEASSTPEMALFHLGSMDWLPNLEGVQWFLDKCWPLIHRRFPELKLYLAGRNFPDQLAQIHLPNVICDGAIKNAKEYISGKQMMIVPLRSGSGMRVKIIEGLALKRTIISTSLGAEGIDVKSGEHLLIADRPEDFVHAIEKCLTDTDFAIRLGSNGRKKVESEYSNTINGERLTAFYLGLAGKQAVK